MRENYLCGKCEGVGTAVILIERPGNFPGNQVVPCSDCSGTGRRPGLTETERLHLAAPLANTLWSEGQLTFSERLRLAALLRLPSD